MTQTVSYSIRDESGAPVKKSMVFDYSELAREVLGTSIHYSDSVRYHDRSYGIDYIEPCNSADLVHLSRHNSPRPLLSAYPVLPAYQCRMMLLEEPEIREPGDCRDDYCGRDAHLYLSGRIPENTRRPIIFHSILAADLVFYQDVPLEIAHPIADAVVGYFARGTLDDETFAAYRAFSERHRPLSRAPQGEDLSTAAFASFMAIADDLCERHGVTPDMIKRTKVDVVIIP